MDRTDYCLDEMVEGAINFRDLGGYPAGETHVRRGLVYRSGMMHHLTDSGLRALAQSHGLRTVIDLRSDEELSGDGISPFEAHAIAHHHAPVMATIFVDDAERQSRTQAMRENRYDWVASYQKMLNEGAPAFHRFFEILADPGALPAVFHCTGGRDRTGVSATLLLSTLGVDDTTVARDYALTGLHLRPHLDRFLPTAARMEMTRAQLADLLETTEEPVLMLLRAIATEYGSTEGYLRAIGVTGDQIVAIQAALLAPITARV